MSGDVRDVGSHLQRLSVSSLYMTRSREVRRVRRGLGSNQARQRGPKLGKMTKPQSPVARMMNPWRMISEGTSYTQWLQGVKKPNYILLKFEHSDLASA